MSGETVDLAIRALRLSALGAANASSLGGLDEPTVKAMFRRLDNDLERIAELHEKEIEAAGKDAARYRWICKGNGYYMEENFLCPPYSSTPEEYAADKEKADREIDAEIASEGES